MGCTKCGAKHRKKSIKVVQGTVSALGQFATVQFRKRVVVQDVANFYPSEIAIVDFGIIRLILEDDCSSLLFLKRTEKIEFNLTYPDLEC